MPLPTPTPIDPSTPTPPVGGGGNADIIRDDNNTKILPIRGDIPQNMRTWTSQVTEEFNRIINKINRVSADLNNPNQHQVNYVQDNGAAVEQASLIGFFWN